MSQAGRRRGIWVALNSDMGRGAQLVLCGCLFASAICDCAEAETSHAQIEYSQTTQRYENSFPKQSRRTWELVSGSFGPFYKDLEEGEETDSLEQGLSDVQTQAISYYCENPYEATCGNQWQSFQGQASVSVDDGPVDNEFFTEVKNSVGRAIFDDPDLTDQAQTMWDKIKNASFEIGNFPFCGNRPNAMAVPPNQVKMCQGMYDKAAEVANREGKGVRSYVFQIVAHELAHFVTDNLARSGNISGWLNKVSRFFDEAGADYLADRALAYWKGTDDPLVLLNASRDGLQVLCGMSQSGDHPLKTDRVMMVRQLDAGRFMCGSYMGQQHSSTYY
jgi:hypothetical protein